MSEFESTELTTGAAGRAEREGLPPGYRMRADAHYVESLSSTPRADRSTSEASRGATESAATGRYAADARDRRFFQQLAEDLAAIEAAAVMLAGDSSPLVRRVSLDLITAQSARAAWLVRARALDDHATGTELPMRARPVAALLADVRDRLSAECRLLGVRLDVHADPAAGVSTDPATLATGLTGAVLALMGLAAGADDPAIHLSAGVSDGRLTQVEVSHRDTPLSPAGVARFFDLDWVDRPGGWLAALGARTAQLAAERLGGSASMMTNDRRLGCAIRLTFA